MLTVRNRPGAGPEFSALAHAGSPGGGRSGVDSSSFDTAVRPQDDFFRHVNGGWIARTRSRPIARLTARFFAPGQERGQSPGDHRRGGGENRRPAGSEARKIGDLYTSFMDEARADELGIKPIEADLARIDAITDKAALIRTLAEFQREGVTGLFVAFVATDAKKSDRYIIYLNQSGISLPDESYYRDAKFKPIREEFVAHVEKMFELAGMPDPKAAAAEVMAVETAAGQAPLGPRQEPRPHAHLQQDGPQALDSLARASTGRPGSASMASANDRRGGRPPARLLHRDGTMLDDVPLDDWKTWLNWHVLHGAAPFLSKPFVDEDFAFSSKTLSARPRTARAGSAASSSSSERWARPSASSTSPSTSRPRPRRG